MRMTVGLAKGRRNKTYAGRRPRHEGRRAPKRSQFRWASRSSHSNEESCFPLKLFKIQWRRPGGENCQHLPNVPRLVDTTLRWALVEDALNEAADQLMLSNRGAVDMRQSHREHRTMKTNRPVSQAFSIKKRQVVQDHRQINGIERNSSGVQKIFEGTPDGIVPIRSRFPPTSGDEAKDGVGEAGGVKPPEIFQTTRCS